MSKVNRLSMPGSVCEPTAPLFGIEPTVLLFPTTVAAFRGTPPPTCASFSCPELFHTSSQTLPEVQARHVVLRHCLLLPDLQILRMPLTVSLFAVVGYAKVVLLQQEYVVALDSCGSLKQLEYTHRGSCPSD